MHNLNSSATIASLLNETPEPVWLLGAGASVTSGIPLAAEDVSKAVKWAYVRQNGKDPSDPRITKIDWYPWPETRRWFKNDMHLADLFLYAIEYLYNYWRIKAVQKLEK